MQKTSNHWNILPVAPCGAIQATNAIAIDGGFDDRAGIPALGTHPAPDASGNPQFFLPEVEKP